MSASTARHELKLTFKHPERYMWHTGTLFGEERCSGVFGRSLVRLFGITLWCVRFEYTKHFGPLQMNKRDSIETMEVYPRAGIEEKGKAK